MKHKDKINFMQEWCNKHNLILVLAGEVGFERQCVGALSEQCKAYPDYIIFDEDYNIVSGEEVWTPEDAYHKHPCVAVLGIGEEAEAQLYMSGLNGLMTIAMYVLLKSKIQQGGTTLILCLKKSINVR